MRRLHTQRIVKIQREKKKKNKKEGGKEGGKESVEVLTQKEFELQRVLVSSALEM